jgi:adenylate kinase family enzyme
VERVVVLGRGAAGKSTFANRLGRIGGLPVIALDDWFWQPGLMPLPEDRWVEVQERLAGRDRWIMDGDLGPYDVLRPRLEAADTAIVLDFSLARCAWRALRRARERADFWRSLAVYRRRRLPAVLAAIETHARHAEVHVLRNPRDVEALAVQVARPRSGATRSAADQSRREAG